MAYIPKSQLNKLETMVTGHLQNMKSTIVKIRHRDNTKTSIRLHKLTFAAKNFAKVYNMQQKSRKRRFVPAPYPLSIVKMA